MNDPRMDFEPHYWEDLPMWLEKNNRKADNAMISRVIENYAIGAYEGFIMEAHPDMEAQRLAEEEDMEIEGQLRKVLKERGLME